MHPRFGAGTAAEASRKAATAAEGSDAAALWANLAELRTIAEAERAALAPLVESVGDATLVEIPLLPTDVHDLAALDHLATHLFPR